MTDSSLGYQRHGAVAVVSIEAAPHNAMSLAFMNAFESLVTDIADDPTIRAVVLTAADSTPSSTNAYVCWPRSRTWKSLGSQLFSVTAWAAA